MPQKLLCFSLGITVYFAWFYLPVLFSVIYLFNLLLLGYLHVIFIVILQNLRKISFFYEKLTRIFIRKKAEYLPKWAVISRIYRKLTVISISSFLQVI